ncbi:MAG: lipocalin family protein [Muribaculaceae bacterium]
MKKLLLMAIAIVGLTACGNSNKSNTATSCADSTATVCDSTIVVGSWVKPIDGMEGTEGFKLNADGSAESINSATLVYKSWSQKNDSTITFICESVGNGQTFSDTATWSIKKLDADSLIINKGEIAFSYTRQK